MIEKDIKKTPVIDSFSRDVTKLAKEGKLDPVIGRSKEIKRLIQILSRRTKNNVILVGEPGVGKSILANGLAQKIVTQDCSPLLHNKRVVDLDIASIVAGTKYRGQFEERLKTIMKELEDNPDIIVFMDEFHTIIGAGSASGSSDASNIIKPALANGKMQVIAATTIDEYQKTIEKDGALNRRFQKIIINQTSVDETIEILNQIKGLYEIHHSVVYSNKVIERIVKLADRYLANKQFPDKAIDILDEVGAFVRGEMMTMKLPTEILELEDKLNLLQIEKKEIVKLQKYEEAAIIRDKERILLETIQQHKDEWINKSKSELLAVTEEHVATIVSSMSGVPVNKLSEDENGELVNLETKFNKLVIGQSKAIHSAVKELQKIRLGIKKRDSCSVLFFGGSSGTGKTLLAKVIAEHFFGDIECLIRINLNEYGEKFSASRLTGAPPGYTGYDEGGELTNKVKSKPYCVILLDEIEKAHPDVMDVFLQVWDEGFLTDSQGFRVDFRNAIFVLTSNIGTKQLAQFGKGIGYSKTSTLDSIDIQNVLLKEIEKGIKVELINRIDEIIIFNNLTTENLYEIIDINLLDLKNRLAVHFDFNINIKVKVLIIKDGFDDKYGARPLARSISKLIENSLVDLMLLGIEPGSVVEADVAEEKIVYEVKKIKKKNEKQD